MKRRIGGWTLASILLGVYLFIKIQGWTYGVRVQSLEGELLNLRPSLSAIVLYKQMDEIRQAYQQVLDQVGRIDVGGKHLLEQISRATPPSVTIEKLEAHSPSDLKIWGSYLPGVRDPEDPITQFSAKLRAEGFRVEVQKLVPDGERPDLWRFELVLTSHA